MLVELGHRAVALPGHGAETLAAWLRKHPGGEVASRDLAKTRSVSIG